MEERKKLKAKAIRLLSRREYSTSNLKKKLLDYGHSFSPEVSLETVESVIDELKSNGWLSDARAVESLINQKISRCGMIKLRVELNKLEVEHELIENYLRKIKSSEYQRAFELLIKRYKHATIKQKEIISQKNYLMITRFDFNSFKRAVDDRSNQMDEKLLNE